MILTDYQELAAVRRDHEEDLIVLTAGSYDLTHPGHLYFFQQARKQGQVLVVSVGRDAEIRKNKGANRPILDEQARLFMIDGLKPVDYAFLTNQPPAGKGWLYPIEEIFQLLHPDVYVVNPEMGDIAAREEICRSQNVGFVVLDAYYPDKGNRISTTAIIQKIQGLP